MAGTPTMLLAFANDQDRYLESLQRESDTISDALRTKKDAGHIDVEIQQGATIDRLFELVSRYGDDLRVFHYGGHANGSALDLQTRGGDNAAAHSQGLAGLLGSLKNLQLVFLNGCATKGHVEALIAAGVPAVIATSAPVEDTIALNFARQFYTCLADPNAARTIEYAFDRAKSYVETAQGSAITIGTTRAMTVGSDEPPAVGTDKWGLYAACGKDAVLAWTLPDKPAGLIMFQTAVAGMAGASISTPNSTLIANLSKAVSKFDADFRELIDFQIKRSRGEPLDERIIRDEVANAFPSPIGAKLLQLFSGGQLGQPRLQLLVNTYDITTRFIAHTLLAQLWDLLDARPREIELDNSQWQAIEDYKACDETAAASFDYLALAITLVNVLKANGAQPFMVECEGLEAAFAAPDCAAAQSFMNRTRQALFARSLDEAAIEAAAAEADDHLDAAMVAMTFVVGYTLAVIKEITISKMRNKRPSYVHQRVVLDRASSTPSFPDPTKALAGFTANQTVVLLKNLDDVSCYIDLSPFMIDENALTHNAGSKLYFLRWYDPQADALHFTLVNEERDRLEISARMTEELKASHLPTLNLYKEYNAVVARR